MKMHFISHKLIFNNQNDTRLCLRVKRFAIYYALTHSLARSFWEYFQYQENSVCVCQLPTFVIYF